MPYQHSELDLIILGGGIVGLALAASLAKTPLKIAVIDHQPALNSAFQLAEPYDLRVSALNHASWKMFANLGLWEQITALRCSSYQEMQVWDANSPAKIHFSCAEIGQPWLGHIVEHNVLRHVLWQFLLTQPRVQLLPETSAVSLLEANDQVALKLANGNLLSAALLVGADGADSWVARQAKLSIKTKPYHQSALVTTVRIAQPHQETAWQRFLTTGPLAFLPLSDPHLVSIVWSTTKNHASYLQQLDALAFGRELTQAMEYRFGAVEAAQQRQVFPLIQKHATNYVKPRIALVGDAAHTIHPLAGQGMNLGLADAHCLAEVLQQRLVEGCDIGAMSALRRFERTRKSENTLMIAAMAGFKQLFGQQQEVLRYLRFAGFAITEKLPFLKNRFMLIAAGL